ncbi:MAG: hypothetical protein V2I97_21050, partial [Desulfococcaceae bacterium]|jgi:hypothetical protein|nr:hypothetical protein [Desulfococcaceae bacterium]
VKEALEKKQIDISAQSDFEKMLHHIENNPLHIGWDENIAQYPQIRMYAKDRKSLIKKLKNNDLEMLRMLDSLSSEIGAFFTYGKISDWLAEVIKELKSKNIADYLMIFWDEFTSVLQHPNSGMLLTELQHIAELSVNKDIHIFSVTHKKIHQTEINWAKDEIEKALGRFCFLDYSMETITTYHIMGAAIQKKEKEKWEKVRDEKAEAMTPLIRRIIGADQGTKNCNLLHNLFPIHPFTAYLCTFIVRYIGSTERSIFNFLHDKDRGFSRFIRENPSGSKGEYLTADYLWDFFMDEFERVDFQRFGPILDKFKLYGEKAEKENPAFSVILKGLLLLNAQYKMVNVSEAKDMLVAPSLDNIRSMFWGSEYQDTVDLALEYLDSAQIISKNPDNLYMVSSSSLPFKEIEREKNALRSTDSQIEKILSAKQMSEIESMFGRGILRESEFCILDASITAHLLKSKMGKVFKKDYALHFVLLIARESSEKEQIRKSVQKILKEGGFENIVFIIPEELFSPQIYEQYIEYRARAKVADRHNFQDEVQTNMEFSNKVLDQWIHGLIAAYMEWYIGTGKPDIAEKQSNGKTLVSNFGEVVNKTLSEKIFYYGMEMIRQAKTQPVWKKEMSKICAENFLFASSLDDLQAKTPSAPNKETREIIRNDLGEYIVDPKLVLKKNSDSRHPLVQMNRKVEDAIEKQKQYGIFHLGDALDFLKKPPFGLYPNKLHLSAMGFLLRNYIGKFYESGKGKPVEKEAMREKVLSIFKYWENGKEPNNLRVRLGTVEEKELIQGLQDIFNLKDVESLNDVKWKIREWIKGSGFPLWVFKLSSNGGYISEGIDCLIELIEYIDQDMNQEHIRKILLPVNMVKTDLRLALKKESSRDLFIAWLKSIDNITFKDEENENIITYIRQNMPEEIGVYSWKESNVREKVKDWHIARLNHNDASGKGSYPAEPTGKSGTDYTVNLPVNPIGNIAEIESLIFEIIAFRGDWSKIIKQMVKNYPETRMIVKKYMDEYHDKTV